MGTLVMKFGGQSLGTTAALTQVLSIVLHEYERQDRLILVVSALEGVTDAVLEALQLAHHNQKRGYRRIAATLRTRHLALTDELPLGTSERKTIQAEIDRMLSEMLDIFQKVADANLPALTPERIDTVLGVGERLAARIVAALVRQNNIRAVALDADKFIITDDRFGNALPDLATSRQRITENLLPMLERKIVPVITGFIGSTRDGRPTTLGRGGTDYTASVVAVCAAASEMWMWTDVDGLMTTDPHEMDDARLIPRMNYQEVSEMAFFGARILHTRMAYPLIEPKIPFRVKNVFKPQQPGTLVDGIGQGSQPKAVTVIQGIGLFTDRSGPTNNVSALINDTLQVAIGSRSEFTFISQAAQRSFFCFVIPTSSNPNVFDEAMQKIEQALNALAPSLFAWQLIPVNVITVVGAQLTNNLAQLAAIFTALAPLPILAVSQSPAQCSFSVVVTAEHSEAAHHKLHQWVLGQP